MQMNRLTYINLKLVLTLLLFMTLNLSNLGCEYQADVGNMADNDGTSADEESLSEDSERDLEPEDDSADDLQDDDDSLVEARDWYTPGVDCASQATTEACLANGCGHHVQCGGEERFVQDYHSAINRGPLSCDSWLGCVSRDRVEEENLSDLSELPMADLCALEGGEVLLGCGHDCGAPIGDCDGVYEYCRCSQTYQTFVEGVGCMIDPACYQADDLIALCEDTGGTWDPDACGYYTCGEAPTSDCTLGGCNCGADGNGHPQYGCSEDLRCQNIGTAFRVSVEWFDDDGDVRTAGNVDLHLEKGPDVTFCTGANRCDAASCSVGGSSNTLDWDGDGEFFSQGDPRMILGDVRGGTYPEAIEIPLLNDGTYHVGVDTRELLRTVSARVIVTYDGEDNGSWDIQLSPGEYIHAISIRRQAEGIEVASVFQSGTLDETNAPVCFSQSPLDEALSVQELCESTGGVWQAACSLGCGKDNGDCDQGVPQCNCGLMGNFDGALGCQLDAQCYDDSACQAVSCVSDANCIGAGERCRDIPFADVSVGCQTCGADTKVCLTDEAYAALSSESNSSGPCEFGNHTVSFRATAQNYGPSLMCPSACNACGMTGLRSVCEDINGCVVHELCEEFGEDLDGQCAINNNPCIPVSEMGG